MVICVPCGVLYLGGRICPQCDAATEVVCACGAEWQPESAWATGDILIPGIDGGFFAHRLLALCGPVKVRAEA